MPKVIKKPNEIGQYKCSGCGFFLAPLMFYKNKATKSGLGSRCKICNDILRPVRNQSKNPRDIQPRKIKQSSIKIDTVIIKKPKAQVPEKLTKVELKFLTKSEIRAAKVEYWTNKLTNKD